MQNQKETRASGSIPEGREYLSLRELSDYLGIPFKTLEGWKAQGYLPLHYAFTKRHHKWKRNEVDEWASTYLFGGRAV